MSEMKEKLFTEFPPVSPEAWKEKIVTDLKGGDFDKKLVWKTSEGFTVNPFYTAEDTQGMASESSLPGEFPFVRGTKIDNEWYVRQDIVADDAKKANEKAKNLLYKGVTSLGFSIKRDNVSKANLETLLDGIYVDCIEVNFRTCNSAAATLTELLTQIYTEKNYDLKKCVGSIGYDPFKKPLVKGVVNDAWVDESVKLFNAAKGLPKYRVLTVNALNFNNAGAYSFQELGYALAWGNEILANLTEAGLDASAVAKKIKFNFGISTNYFMEIAKFRAARLLWANIVAAYQKEGDCQCAAKIYAHAQTSEWNMTVYDAHVNLLRSQTEAMSASLAGVDSLTVTPFDKSFKAADDFSERIARNQQLLLKEECHFDKVADPSAGSYYIETLTWSLAQEAWKLFLATEKEGGFYTAVKNETVQKAVNASSKTRRAAIATRREVLLGTNQFPNFTETAGNKVEETHACGCGCGCNATLEPLCFERGATDFEQLRMATEKSGKTPTVFMLTIGNLAMRLARSQFSSNFFACAGYKLIDNLGFETVEAGVKAAFDAKADIIVLCSSDDEYAQFAPEAQAAINGKATLVIAGAPACMDELKTQGIDLFINVKSNVLETLKQFNAKLNIA